MIAGVEHSLPPFSGGYQLERKLCLDLLVPIRNPISGGQMSVFPEAGEPQQTLAL